MEKDAEGGGLRRNDASTSKYLHKIIDKVSTLAEHAPVIKWTTRDIQRPASSSDPMTTFLAECSKVATKSESTIGMACSCCATAARYPLDLFKGRKFSLSHGECHSILMFMISLCLLDMRLKRAHLSRIVSSFSSPAFNILDASLSMSPSIMLHPTNT